MMRVLIVENSKADFHLIKKLLLASDAVNYQVKHATHLTREMLLASDFEVILLCQSKTYDEDITALKNILSHKLLTPIIYLSATEDENIDQQIMSLGADDYLSIDSLTSLSLHRCIQHAVHRKQIEDETRYLSTHDQLTGLANRYLLYEHLERTINISRRNDRQFEILFIDIDKFKLINESLGHEIGDILLVQVAEKLTACVRESDIVARFGNDEFAILLEESDTNRNINLIVEKIRKVMAKVFIVRQHELFITTSMGIAIYPESGKDSETILKNAGSALYKAKELGRNKYQFFTHELNQQAKLKLELEKNLRRALIKGEFSIYLQPQICTHSRKIAGAEALLRWNHPRHGFVSPESFIPLLDELSLLPGVEAWVIREVCEVAKRLTDVYGHMNFSVNISGSHFKTGNLKENVYMALQSSSLDAKFLEIELTEDIMIEHVERNSNLLNDLKDLGLTIALDDFGKGYSSLSYLKNFPADILKIDKAFIDHIVTDKRDASIVEAMISLSHTLDMKVVAEGVEDSLQLAKLELFDCDYIQGYYFAKPMSIDDFSQFVRSRSARTANSRINNQSERSSK